MMERFAVDKVPIKEAGRLFFIEQGCTEADARVLGEGEKRPEWDWREGLLD